MKFQSPIEAQIEIIHQHLEFLQEQLIQEQIQLAEKLKSQGWIEVKRENEYDETDPEEMSYGCWYFFNPSVSSDVIKKAREWSHYYPFELDDNQFYSLQIRDLDY